MYIHPHPDHIYSNWSDTLVFVVDMVVWYNDKCNKIQNKNIYWGKCNITKQVTFFVFLVCIKYEECNNSYQFEVIFCTPDNMAGACTWWPHQDKITLTCSMHLISLGFIRNSVFFLGNFYLGLFCSNIMDQRWATVIFFI